MSNGKPCKPSILLPNIVLSILATGAVNAHETKVVSAADSKRSATNITQEDIRGDFSKRIEASPEATVQVPVRCPFYYNSGTGQCNGEYSELSIVDGLMSMKKFSV